MGVKALELAMNRTVLNGEQLNQIEIALDDFILEQTMSLSPMDKALIANFVMITESHVYWPTTTVNDDWDTSYSLNHPYTNQILILLDLLRIEVFDNLFCLYSALERKTSPGVSVPTHNDVEPSFSKNVSLAAWRVPSRYLSYGWHLNETLWQTNLLLAKVAINVEKFQRDRGRLPQSLSELVPEYLKTIPVDYYGQNKPLLYKVRENGEWLVYSVFTNGKDDGGVAFEEEQEGKGGKSRLDLTFVTQPMEKRKENPFAETDIQ